MVAGVIVSFESFAAGIETTTSHPVGTYRWHLVAGGTAAAAQPPLTIR